MTSAVAFDWNERARLFAGNHAIVRPNVTAPPAFVSIAAHPTNTALSQLGLAVQANSSFCISDTPLPKDTQTAPGQFLTLTGGSSGQPKLIRRTQASWINSFVVNAKKFTLTTDDSVAVLGKLNHSLALYGVLEAVHLGMNAHALDEMRPATQCATLAERQISVIYATPTQLRLLAQTARGTPLPAVRLILCGGGTLDISTKTAAQTLCPNAAIHVFYGAAETSFITLADANTPDGSVGRAYPGVTLQVRDANGAPAPQLGEVWVKSPYVFEGYLSGRSANTQQKDGFVTVGEIGRLDANGNLWLMGRKGRMVTIADQNIFPEDIETLITNSLQADLCAVIPVPDATRGHRLVAVMQGQPDAAVAQAVKDVCRIKFGALRTPTKVLFHPDLPLLSSGKIDLVALTKWVKDQS
ncbi:MAG: AMP-binding protein [Sulfitobacter sp.]